MVYLRKVRVLTFGDIYNGNVTTNAAGGAIVSLPEWFETPMAKEFPV